MTTTGRTKGGRKRPAHLIRALIAFIGYLLSPLSPWNDAFVNVPLSILIAWLLSGALGFYKAYWIGYLLTNIAGLLMLYIAARDYLKKLRWSELIESLLIAVIVYVILTTIINNFP